MGNELIKLETQELSLIEKSKAEQIKKTFEPMVKMLEAFEDEYNKIILDSKKEITTDITSKAKRLRLDIGKIRIETGKIKDKQKEYIKLEDKAIMGVHNILVWAVQEKEDKLKEIEKHFEIQEQKRLEELQIKRVEELSLYVQDAQERNLSGMEEDVWNAYLSTKKQEYLDRIEAERQAEEDRLEKAKAEKEEQERIRQENEKLRKEREEQEKRIAEERKKAEAERKALEEKARKEKAIQEEKLRKEREERAEIERQIKEKEAEKEAERQAELKAKEDAEKAPDKNKVMAYIQAINNIEVPKIKNKKLSNILDTYYLRLASLLNELSKEIN